MIYPFLVLWVVAMVWWVVKRIHPIFKRLALRIVRKYYRKSLYMTLVVTAVSLSIICIIALNFVDDKGGLIGSAIGGIGTLVAVLVTIKSSIEQQEKSKETILRPYFTIKKVKATFTNKLISGHWPNIRHADPPEIEDYWVVSFSQQTSTWKYECTLQITLSNVGVGPAINLKRSIIEGNTPESFPACDVPEDGTHDLFFTFVTSSNPLDDRPTEGPSYKQIEFSYQSILDCKFRQYSRILVDFVPENGTGQKIVVQIEPLSSQRVFHR